MAGKHFDRNGKEKNTKEEFRHVNDKWKLSSEKLTSQNCESDFMQTISSILDTFKDEIVDCKVALENSLSRQKEISLQQKETKEILEKTLMKNSSTTQTLIPTPSKSEETQEFSVTRESETDSEEEIIYCIKKTACKEKTRSSEMASNELASKADHSSIGPQTQ